MNKSKLLNILKIALSTTIFLIIVFNYKALSNLDVRVLIAGASSVLAAELIVLGVYVVKSVLLVLPASLIYISVGMAFDWRRAVAINLIGIAVEVTVTYFMGRFLGKDAVEKRLRSTKGGEKLLNMQDKNKNLATFLIRLVPAFPIDFSSLFMGAFDFKFLPYFVFSLLGLAPRVAAFTVLGEGIYKLIPMKFIMLAVVFAIPVAVAVIFIKKYADKKKS